MAEAAETVIFPTARKLVEKMGRYVEGPIDEKSAEFLIQQDKSKFEYVEIPSEDIFNKHHQGVSVNGIKLEAGKRYFMAAPFAAEVRERLAMGQKADIRILQSHPDQQSVRGDRGVFPPRDAEAVR